MYLLFLTLNPGEPDSSMCKLEELKEIGVSSRFKFSREAESLVRVLLGKLSRGKNKEQFGRKKKVKIKGQFHHFTIKKEVEGTQM